LDPLAGVEFAGDDVERRARLAAIAKAGQGWELASALGGVNAQPDPLGMALDRELCG
jgi:hypothetical protein